MNEVPQRTSSTNAQAQSTAGCSRWIGLGGLALTLLLYWGSDAWYSIDWNELGLAYSDGALAKQIYQQWSNLRYGELGLACVCLVLIMFNQRMRYPRLIAVVSSAIVIAVWVIWVYHPVKCGASLPGFCVPLY